jgi:multisubunit Na+/H+ antiporter MnhB subunit
MKIAAFLITGLINVSVGIVLFFFLLLGLNGFSGKQAEPGLILYIVWVLIASVITAVLSLWLTNYLTAKKGMNSILAGLIPVTGFVIIGAVSTFVALIAAVILVDALR